MCIAFDFHVNFHIFYVQFLKETSIHPSFYYAHSPRKAKKNAQCLMIWFWGDILKQALKMLQRPWAVKPIFNA